jgi:hypothetical protein
MSKIEIRKWHVLDIYYKNEDREEAMKLVVEYTYNGWSLENEDDAGNKDYDGVFQLMKHDKIKSKRIDKT